MLIESLHNRTNVPVDALQNVARSASKRYKVYKIEKRTGGHREISHPSRMLKAIQRWLTRNLLSAAEVHECATAYQKGSSIRKNAMHHAGTSYTLRMDFANFFPSFDQGSIILFLKSLSAEHTLGLTDADIEFASKIFCKDGRLTIGAPSSPKLTNAMMRGIDIQIHSQAAARNVIYTRYADDIFLSSFDPNVLIEVEQEVRAIVAAADNPKLLLNDSKTLHLSKANHRAITGLVITTDGKVSLGRSRKRFIRSQVYQAINNNLEPVAKAKLAGLIAFASDSDPDFLGSLSQKFKMDISAWAKSLW